MSYFYVLYSLKDGRLYKGATSDLLTRLKQHNAGRSKSTQHRRPLILLYFEEYQTYQEARQREAWAKTLEGGTALKALLVKQGLLLEDGTIGSGSSAG